MKKPLSEFDAIFQTHKNGMYRLCLMMVDQVEDAEDLFQEVSINLWKNLARFQGRSKIETWIYRIVVNTSLTFNQRRQRERIHQAAFAIEKAPETRQTSAAIEAIREAIQYLGSADKAVIGLYLEGFSHKEIAALLQLSMSNVGVKINRIKKKLAQIIHQ